MAGTPRPAPPTSRSCRRILVLIVAAVASVAWLDRWEHARQGNRLYADGKFDDASGKYNEALVDHPDSALLHFNLGDARYRENKYDEALAAFAGVPAGDEYPARAARVAYNVGNVKYRLGEAAEKSDPQKALGLWTEAVASYRRALGAAPDDEDAKFNHELVEKKIAELRKKLEEEKQKQEEQKQQEQNQQQQDQDQQNQEQQQQEQQAEQPPNPDEQAPDKPQQQPEADQQRPEQQAGKQESPANQSPAGEAQRGEGGAAKDGQMSRQEATALLDAQRSDEVPPEDVTKRMQGGVVGEPAQDW